MMRFSGYLRQGRDSSLRFILLKTKIRSAEASVCDRTPSEDIYGHFSGPLKPDVPNYCVYEVEFQTEGGQVTDPHIKTGP
jgi:hypothetical protein